MELAVPAADYSVAGHAMSDPILAKAEKCFAAWDAFRASGQRQPVPLYCTEHDEWERQLFQCCSLSRYDPPK